MLSNSKPLARVKAWAARFRRAPAPAPEPGGAAFIVVALFTVAVVAAVAFTGSYEHQYEIVIRYGQAHWVAGMQPLSVEGLIAGATLVIWYAARYGWRRPWGAWLVLLAAVAQTAVMNLAADHRYAWPWLGPEISIWPAVAFVAAYEMAVWLVRKRQDATRRAGADTGSPPAGSAPAPVPVGVPADAQDAALLALRHTTAAGNPLSLRQLETRFGLSRSEATRVRELVSTEANGRHPPEPVITEESS